uniref:NADH-ubiquinone oxidoreductase chain 6 n=1 Tax=Inara alboguttata TaxID=1239030 RepID=A0A343W8S3_9HEMI|nr:NADH dehydrogenase subunit 6 [Inara alboguttata]AVZ00763.1 NADH dehydrogenase subunit 6 [Inara alboguttata]
MFMLTLSLTMSITFPLLKHPLSMGLILIIQTLLIAMMTGLMTNSFWLSYILLITMLSGALVLFMYMASIASNEKFESSTKLALFMLMMFLTATMYMLVDQMDKKSIWSTNMSTMISNDQIMSLTKLFNENIMYVTLTMICYLFLTMIIVSYIVEVSEGPLRLKS